MTRTSHPGRSLLSVPALLVALALPWVGCSPRKVQGTTTTVIVGPGPCDLSPSTAITLSKRSGDQIAWRARDSTRPLVIVFRKSQMPASTPPPFTNMAPNANGDWQIGTNLQSGAVNAQLDPPAAGFSYKYDQVLGGVTCDGRIIIQP